MANLLNAIGGVLILLCFEALPYGTVVVTGTLFWSKTSLERQIGSRTLGVVVIFSPHPSSPGSCMRKQRIPALAEL